MPERFKTVVPCKALYKCSAFYVYLLMQQWQKSSAQLMRNLHWIEKFTPSPQKRHILQCTIFIRHFDFCLQSRYGARIPGQQLGDICVRRQHRNWSYLPPAVQHSVTERSLSPLFAPGMLYRIQCHLLRHSLLSDDFYRHIFSNSVFSPSFYLFLTLVQCPWCGFHCDSVTLILSSDDDNADDVYMSSPAIGQLHKRNHSVWKAPTAEWIEQGIIKHDE